VPLFPEEAGKGHWLRNCRVDSEKAARCPLKILLGKLTKDVEKRLESSARQPLAKKKQPMPGAGHFA